MKPGCQKYIPFEPINLPDRQWPGKTIEKPPVWCSVDLRDGNQALIDPMNLKEKIEYFKTLIKIGFKEIEVGFPSASETEYEILRTLIEKNLIPDDVTIQVLVQSREHLIRKTFEAIDGAKNVIIHFYNSTSTLQRKVVFKKDMDGVIDIAVQGAKLIKQLTDELKAQKDVNIRYEYSPESFSGTEMDNAVLICEKVMEALDINEDNKIILNLPATVEGSTPNGHADQIEYFCRKLKNRENAIISLHPHNDRGTAVAAAELGLLAGADRIEGTLFGNGERTGNVDIVTLALNMYTQGIDPGLDFSNINEIKEMFERTTKMPVDPRKPYGGALVFTAFSGSHQDAINKGKEYMRTSGTEYWEVPYLPIDPADVGREYEPIIRINSQSGKGGISYILEHNFGYELPKEMAQEVGYFIKDISDHAHKELSPQDILVAFTHEYQNKDIPIAIQDISWIREKGTTVADVTLAINNEVFYLSARGNGPLDAVSNVLKLASPNINYQFVDYEEHALQTDSDSLASAYVVIADDQGKHYWGVGVDSDITMASVYALVTAINRENKDKQFIPTID